LTKLRVLDLFSGIGGFSLGLERAGGFETVAFCEIEDFPRKVLRKHWPEVPIYEDVRTLTADVLAGDGIAVDVITGGFPCQDISVTGRKAGIADGTRSGLWSEIVRLVGELRPRYVIVENVANLLSGPSEQRGGWFGRVLGDLAECGYDAEWENIPASSVGAPHRRERVWIVSYPMQERPDAGTPRIFGNGFACYKEWNSSERSFKFRSCRDCAPLANADEARLQGREKTGNVGKIGAWGDEQPKRRTDSAGRTWPTEPAVGRVAHGVPNRVDRLGALGNAVVPQIPELIGRAIMAAQKEEA
jgi:DNA (cytosine-5)-methyltransferase 1